MAPRDVYEVDACQEHLAELDRPTRAANHSTPQAPGIGEPP